MYPRIVWLYWAQGWDKAPELCQKVRKSWEMLNPTWEIRALSYRDVTALIDMTHFPHDNIIQIQSDFIRLSLLATYGGVWADSTLLCMKPLDSWLPEDAPFFMFRGSLLGKHNPTGSCTWFLACKKDCYTMKKWRDALIDRWNNVKTPRWMMSPLFTWNYFSIDYMFDKIQKEDEMCKREWNSVRYIPCYDTMMLIFKFTGYSYEIENKLKNDPPPVLKLDWRVKSSDPETNINVAFRTIFSE